LTSLTGGRCSGQAHHHWHGSPTAPMSPEAATPSRGCRGNLQRFVQSSHLGPGVAMLPPVWPAALIEMTPRGGTKPHRGHGRRHRVGRVVERRRPDQDLDDNGARATACTISVSSTSSPLASQGDAVGARVVTARRSAAGKWNNLSNWARSWRISLTGAGTAARPARAAPRSRRGRRSRVEQRQDAVATSSCRGYSRWSTNCSQRSSRRRRTRSRGCGLLGCTSPRSRPPGQGDRPRARRWRCDVVPRRAPGWDLNTVSSLSWSVAPVVASYRRW